VAGRPEGQGTLGPTSRDASPQFLGDLEDRPTGIIEIAAIVIAVAFWAYIGWWLRSVRHHLIRCREALERLSPMPLPGQEPSEPDSLDPVMAHNIERLERGFH
jgi:hypothetical protein